MFKMGHIYKYKDNTLNNKIYYCTKLLKYGNELCLIYDHKGTMFNIDCSLLDYNDFIELKDRMQE